MHVMLRKPTCLQAEQRAERDQRRRVAAESRQARERSKRHAEERRKPVNVVMSNQQQAALEDALHSGNTAADHADDSWDDELEPGPPSCSVVWARITNSRALHVIVDCVGKRLS